MASWPRVKGQQGRPHRGPHLIFRARRALRTRAHHTLGPVALFGRDPEKKAISELIANARDGQSGVLAIVGAPGMGKSTLVAFAEQEAVSMRLLRARGVQSETQVPFGGLFELLRPALGCLPQIPGPQAAALESALALGPARALDRFAVGAATLSLLAAYSDTVPLLVVVDDAHWVDGSTSDALLFAFRRLVADPIAVVVSVRDGEPSLVDGADLRQLRLDGLDRAAAADLLALGAARPVPDELVARLHRQTGGNPLALLEASVEIERFRHGAPLDTPLPLVTSIASVYLIRTRALPPASLRLLLLAAASDTGDLSLLARAAPALGVQIGDLSAPEQAGLVTTAEGELHFRHPLVRSAVYNDASPDARRDVHRALADALPDAEADRRAWHLALSVLGPDDAACAALEQAGLRARQRSAYDVSSRAFERAARLAPDDAWRGRLLYEAADSAWLGGLVERAQDLLGAMSEYALSPELTGYVDHLKGHMASRSGRVGEAQVILARGAERVAAADPGRAVVMLAEAVNAAFYAGDPKAMGDAGARIAEVAPRAGGQLSLLFASTARGLALTLSGEAESGAALLRQAVSVAEESDELADDPRLLEWAAIGPLCLRDASAGRELISRALDVTCARAAIGELPYLLNHVAVDHATTDRWAEGEAVFHEVIDLARETGQMTDLAAALSRLAWLEARQGQSQQSRAHATEALELAQTLGLRLCEIWATAALGELELGQGKTAEALAGFQRQEEILRECGIADADLSPAPELVELYLRLGQRGPASEAASVFGCQATSKGQPWALARAARCRGLLATDEQLDGEFARALEFHAETLDVFETARTRLVYGSRLRRSRQRARSRDQLRAAVQQFDELGAGPWSKIARAELSATGEAARERGPSTRDQLTPQEFQIASLLASGRTTREAAGSLFLSPKTVEYHLRSVYRKLGVSSRDELALAMEGGEGTGQPGRE
jgi:DNA-binding CsgD family transcriptional regulator/tetratricopeptide (TPR) repeat protein